MKANDATLAAASRRYDPAIRLILFYGNDASASGDLARVFMRQFAVAGEPVSETSFTASDLTADPAALLAAASEVSMFGDVRPVRVDGASDDILPAVTRLLDARVAGNPVTVTAGALKKTSKLLVLVEKAANALAYASYVADAAGAAATINALAAEVGLRPSRDAVEALVAATGGDRGIVRSELAKLALYLDASPEAPAKLEASDVGAVGADLGEADFSALVAGVAGGRPEIADRQLAHFAIAGIPGITLLRTVARRFWLLLDLRLAIDGGASASSAVAGARPPVFWKERDAIVGQLGLWRTPAIRAVLARLLAAERAVKASGSLGDVAVDHLLLGIATQAARR